MANARWAGTQTNNTAIIMNGVCLDYFARRAHILMHLCLCVTLTLTLFADLPPALSRIQGAPNNAKQNVDDAIACACIPLPPNPICDSDISTGLVITPTNKFDFTFINRNDIIFLFLPNTEGLAKFDLLCLCIGRS